MPLLSEVAKQAKLRYFTPYLAPGARVLEVGCGDGWLGQALRERGWTDYVGLDLKPPADVVGDIAHWRELGLAPASFDAIFALEVVEHVHCFQECCDLLRPGGLLFLTTPLPHMDWLCRVLEALGLNQKRTSPHDQLMDLRDVPLFETVHRRVVLPTAQWGVFRKPAG